MESKKRTALMALLAAALVATLSAGCAAVSGPGVTGITASPNDSIRAVGQFRLQQQSMAIHRQLVQSCVDGNVYACGFMGQYGIQNPEQAFYYGGLIPYTGPGSTYYPAGAQGQYQQLPGAYHTQLMQMAQEANTRSVDAMNFVRRMLRRLEADRRRQRSPQGGRK